MESGSTRAFNRQNCTSVELAAPPPLPLRTKFASGRAQRRRLASLSATRKTPYSSEESAPGFGR